VGPLRSPAHEEHLLLRVQPQALAAAGAAHLPELLAHGVAGDHTLAAGQATQALDRRYGDLLRQAGDGQLAYKLDYILSEQGDAWAGMAFKFSEPQNLAPYSFLEIALLYGSQTVRLDLIFKDVNGKESRLALGPGMTYPTEVTAEGSGLSQTVHVPLGYFKDVNLEFIREITLHADSSRGRGAFNVIVEWLELLEED